MLATNPISTGFLPPLPTTREFTPLDGDVVELALLLPRWQAEAIEEAAHSRGVSAAQMLRKIIAAGLRG